MKALTVFYDARCGLCGATREWFEREPKFVAMHFVPYDSQLAGVLFPQIKEWNPEREILVLSEEGGVYRGGAAWVMCLWATVRLRKWSMRLARPALLPLAEKFCRLVSRNRHFLSRLLALKSDGRLRREIEHLDHGHPAGGACPRRAGL